MNAGGDGLEPGRPVEMAHAPRTGSALRGIIVATRPGGSLPIGVRWAGRPHTYWYRPSELRPAEQDDQGRYALEVALF